MEPKSADGTTEKGRERSFVAYPRSNRQTECHDNPREQGSGEGGSPETRQTGPPTSTQDHRNVAKLNYRPWMIAHSRILERLCSGDHAMKARQIPSCLRLLTDSEALRPCVEKGARWNKRTLTSLLCRTSADNVCSLNETKPTSKIRTGRDSFMFDLTSSIRGCGDVCVPLFGGFDSNQPRGGHWEASNPLGSVIKNGPVLGGRGS